MEHLRWILLGAGAVFVLVIYLLGRSRRQRNYSMMDEMDDDLPDFSANNLDDVDEGVGEVRVVTRGEPAEVYKDAPDPGVTTATVEDAAVDDSAIEAPESVPKKKPAAKLPSDLIALFILPKGDNILLGSQINSSAQAMGLSFGEMNIFHYRPQERNVFSMANMLEPGSFDPNTIHELKTTGLTIFMQIGGADPMDDLTEMLQRSYQLAGLLDARLCNHKREPLTEQDAEDYRTRVRNFAESRTPELFDEV